MSVVDDSAVSRRARAQIARRRGALIGFILIILGAWGAVIPFVGPYFHYAFTPTHTWRWTASRGWLEVLPGAVTALGGLLVLISKSRATAVLGAWLAAAAGAWFAIGTSFEPILHTGPIGVPAGSNSTLRVLESIGFFYGLGVVIVFFAATAAGRLSVRSPGDIHRAQRDLEEEAGARIRARDAETNDAPTSDAAAPRHGWHRPTVEGQPEQDTPVGMVHTTDSTKPGGSHSLNGGATTAADADRANDVAGERRIRP